MCLYLNILNVPVALRKGEQGRPVKYWQAGQSCANYLHKIGPIYVGADSIALRLIQLILYKLRYYSINIVSLFVPNIIFCPIVPLVLWPLENIFTFVVGLMASPVWTRLKNMIPLQKTGLWWQA